jgi:superfamily I DNA and RNA helicase
LRPDSLTCCYYYTQRALWLDQEFALQLKGAVVLAHQPELWKDIGEGLKPKLTRGVRIVLQATELNDQGEL